MDAVAWIALGVAVQLALIWIAARYAGWLGLDPPFWGLMTFIFGPFTLLGMRLIAGRRLKTR